jgi:hypothetical protein
MASLVSVDSSTQGHVAWRGNVNDPHDVRLQAALIDADRRLAELRANVDQQNPGMFAICQQLLRRAEEEAGRGGRYVAWDCLHQFDEVMLAALSDDERRARWCTLCAEANGKLKDSWRGEAAECLVKLAPSDPKPVPLHLVRELLAHINTSAQNQQHKLELFEKQSLPYLAASLALAVLITLASSGLALAVDERLLSAAWVQPISPWAAAAGPWAHAFVLGIPGGALGGILSMAFTLGRADLQAKIPDMRLSRLVTLTRPLLGATVAIPVVVLIQAGFVKFAGFEGSLGTFTFCFLGGFSERWFLGVIERFDRSKK